MNTVEKACEDYMEFVRSDKFNEDEMSDYEYYIFEAAMIDHFGEDIYKEISARMG